MLPDRSVLIGQKLVENAEIQKFKCDILSNFQTMLRKVRRRPHLLSTHPTKEKSAFSLLLKLGPF